MDELVSVLAEHPEIAASVFGPEYIDSRYERGSWAHRYYTAFYLLRDREEKAWLTYYQLYVMPKWWSNAKKPDRRRIRRFEEKFRRLLNEVGIELWPLEG